MWKNGNSLQQEPSLGAGTTAGTAGTNMAFTGDTGTRQGISTASKIGAVAKNEPGSDIDAYTFLRRVWNDELQPTHIRMRAAAIGIEFERPRMSVSAVIESHDFAAILEQRIKNFERIQNGGVIEAQPKAQPVEQRPVKPHVIDRRYRRV